MQQRSPCAAAHVNVAAHRLLAWGELTLKNIARPVRAFRLSAGSSANPRPPSSHQSTLLEARPKRKGGRAAQVVSRGRGTPRRSAGLYPRRIDRQAIATGSTPPTGGPGRAHAEEH